MTENAENAVSASSADKPADAPKDKKSARFRGFVRPKFEAMKPDDILAIGEEIEDERAQAIFFMLYLTGARINELTGLVRARIDADGAMSSTRPCIRIYNLPTEKNRKRSTRSLVIPLGRYAKCKENEMWTYVADYLSVCDDDPVSFPFRVWKHTGDYLARRIKVKGMADVWEI